MLAAGEAPSATVSGCTRTHPETTGRIDNVYPREVEEVLNRHPGVSQVAVIGIPDERRGEEICAVVVPADPTATFDGVEMIEWSKLRLAKYKYPRRVHVVDALPLGPSHKVLKKQLREAFSCI